MSKAAGTRSPAFSATKVAVRNLYASHVTASSALACNPSGSSTFRSGTTASLCTGQRLP
ncbi:hypothetical protein CES85_3605 (plasmid) [Ochrobactrum quorumnocens]|uniref:Uncharacterized protein n=1 Tax=Ochrobactrum quorumnocens TaxID=271865 RepID=A0A248UPD9_9HYPH|nr:hypothetical protein CES85_3605 [[Ochrobactrum] quorumnocens]